MQPRVRITKTVDNFEPNQPVSTVKRKDCIVTNLLLELQMALCQLCHDSLIFTVEFTVQPPNRR